MAEVTDLLRERETQGLRGALIARVTMALLFMALEFVIFGTLYELVVSVVVCLAAALAAWILLRMLDRGGPPTPVGLAAVTIDLIVLTVFPFVWLSSVGGSEAMPFSFTLKGGLASLMMVVIVFNTLALRPLYPLIASLGSVAVYLGFVTAAVADPRTQLSRDYVESLMGPSLGIGMTIANVAMILLVGGGACLTALLARRLTIDGVRLEKATAQLGRYFSPAVRDKISAASTAFLEPGGEEQIVTVLFCDIRNFTGLSESMTPQAVMALLSDYHSRMVEVVFAHGGTLDKFIGDAVMATFGTPQPAPDDTLRAVRAGIAMRLALAELNRERAIKGLPEIQHGTGIHVGPAIVGNVGTPERLEYTAIGDTVNVASRIAAACKSTGSGLLISEAVKAQIEGAVPLRPIEAVQLPGKAEAVTLFAVDEATTTDTRPD